MNRSSLQNARIAVIGAGNMGGALIGGLVESGVPPANLIASDAVAAALESVAQGWGVETTSDNRAAVQGRDVVLLAVKPQIAPAVLGEIAPALRPGCLLISIMAGFRTAAIESALGRPFPVVRAMPNLMAQVRAAAAALCPGRHATGEHLETARQVMGAVGSTVVVEEKQMDAVTGLSGSGPAYVFVLIDALADGGVKMGLPRPVALQLAAQTVLGAARMVAESGEHPAALKDRVTSPGGTTIAGLHALEQKGFRDALMSAVEAATRRSEELGK
jgi:pyrroline-5-carboxylate reductase